MATELFYGLLPDHLVLALMLALMLLEGLRASPALGRVVYLALLAAAGAALAHQIAGGYAADIAGGEVTIDRFALAAKSVMVALGFAAGLALPRAASYKTWLLLASSLFGALIIMDSAGFVALFLGIEMLSLPAFALIVHQRGASVAAEGAFKYLLMSAIATALLLFGMSLAYMSTGSLAIADFVATVGSGRGLDMAATVLMLAGFFVKAAVFPLHGWAPDAYSAARLPVTALLASIVKGAVVLALARVFAAATLDATVVTVVIALALASIVFGNLAALAQTRFRRLLAYSSVAHAGYMIFALAGATGSRADDLLWYVGLYAAATLLACASYSVLAGHADGAADGDDARDELGVLDGGFARHPLAAVLLALAVLSLAGLPPMPGFFAKLFIFQSAIASGHLVPAVLAFAGSFIGLGYYVAIVVRLFRSDAIVQPTQQPQ